MDLIPYDFDDFRPSFTSPYSIPSPVVSVVAMALIEALAHFTLRFPSPIYEPFFPSIPLYAFGSYPIPSAFTYDFDDSRYSFTSSLFDSKPSNFCGYYGSYRGSGIHFDFIPLIYGPLL
jgi:hypothetical protein